eukprot:3737206-Amphidinium_carterae.1
MSSSGTNRGEVPVGAGALIKARTFKTEARNGSRVLQACSKCYKRVPLAQLEQFAIERVFPLYVQWE